MTDSEDPFKIASWSAVDPAKPTVTSVHAAGQNKFPTHTRVVFHKRGDVFNEERIGCDFFTHPARRTRRRPLLKERRIDIAGIESIFKDGVKQTEMPAFPNPSGTINEEAIVSVFSEMVLSCENDKDKPVVLIRKTHTKLADEKLKEIELILLG